MCQPALPLTSTYLELVSLSLLYEDATILPIAMVIKSMLPWNDKKYDEFQDPRSYQQEDCVSCRVLGRTIRHDTESNTEP